MRYSRLIKKTVLVYALLPVIFTNSVQADEYDEIYADDSEPVTQYEQEHVGLGVGAIFGAILGGPPGLIIGAVGGSVLGRNTGIQDDLEKTNQELDDAKLALDNQRQINASLNKTIVANRNHANAPVMVASTRMPPSDYDSDAGKQLIALIENGFALNIQFRTNSSALESHFQHQVEQISKILHKIDSLDIQLNGYADPRGSDVHNLSLSKKRIDVIRAALISQGLSEDRIHIHAWGESNRLSENMDNETLDFERRVLIRFTSRGGRS